MSTDKFRNQDADPNPEEQLRALEELFNRVRKAATEAAEACGQYAVRAEDQPYTGPALPGRGAFHVIMRNDPEAGTFVRRLQGRELELKTAAAIIVAELAGGSDDAAASICNEILAAVVATNQQRRDALHDTFTGQLEEDFPQN